VRVFLIGYPGRMGGANTEALHLVHLWRRFGVDVHLVPTWGRDESIERELNEVGCTTHHVEQPDLESVPGLAGSICVGMCNSEFCKAAGRLRKIGCKLAWVNCMTFLFSHEKEAIKQHGFFDAMIFHSEYQRGRIEPELKKLGPYKPASAYKIRGAFDFDAWEFNPRPHEAGKVFFFGRAARPSKDKWSSNHWPIYERVQYPRKKAIVLGVNGHVEAKIGQKPPWAVTLKPNAIPVREYYPQLHAMLAINGGAHENWPRAGLEAMATGVPVVAQDSWGWREMIRHGETGFLGSSDAELAHRVAQLAWDEPLRLKIARQAREHLVHELALPEQVWAGWRAVFDRLAQDNPGRRAAA